MPPTWWSRLGIATPDDYSDLIDTYGLVVWVYVCVHSIAAAFARAEWVLQRADRDGEWHIVDDDPFFELLMSPNPDMSGARFREALMVDFQLTGNAYVEIVRDGQGAPVHLWPISPSKMRVTYQGGKRSYVYLPDSGRPIPMEDDTVLHVRASNPDDAHYGVGAVGVAKNAIITELYAERFNQTFFEHGAVLSGTLMTDAQIDSEEQAKRIKKTFLERHGGYDRAHQVALLSGGMKFVPTQETHRDMEYGTLRRWTREEILAAFGVPPAAVGIYTEGPIVGQSSAETQMRTFWESTMGSLERLFAAELEREFLDASWRVVFTHEGISALQDSPDVLVERLSKFSGVLSGHSTAITPNEVRGILRENFPTLFRGWLDDSLQSGDQLWVPGIIMPTGLKHPSPQSKAAVRDLSGKILDEPPTYPRGIDMRAMGRLIQRYTRKLSESYMSAADDIMARVFPEPKTIMRYREKTPARDREIIETIITALLEKWTASAETEIPASGQIGWESALRVLERDHLLTPAQRELIETRMTLQTTSYMTERMNMIIQDLQGITMIPEANARYNAAQSYLLAQQHRAESFAGTVLSVGSEVFAKAGLVAGRKVGWHYFGRLDGRSCPTCEELGEKFVHDEGSLRAIPGGNTECNGRCRCVLEILEEPKNEH